MDSERGSWARDREIFMTSAERLAAVLFVAFVLLAPPQPVLAAPPIFVGHGTPGSCTEMALKDALIIAETVGGATIRFKCGPEPVTIALSDVTGPPFAFRFLLALPNNTTIDGGGLITLDGTHTATVAFVDRDTTVVLTRLSIINGFGGNQGQGANGIENRGTLTVDHSTLSGNNSAGDGAISNSGTLTVEHSTLSGNFGFLYGGIFNAGMLTVRKSSFEGNFSLLSGGGILNRGTLIVDDSTFSGNFGFDGGGGIYNRGTLTVRKSTFSENEGFDGGGGIFNAGMLTVRKSSFEGNFSHNPGGGIFNFGTLTVDDSTFSENRAFGMGTPFGFGGGIANFGTVTVDKSTFSGNVADLGGGIFNAGPLAVDDSTITQNTANTAGGGIYICVEGQETFTPCHGTLTLNHTSVTENTPDNIFP